MEVECSSETSYLKQTTRRYMTEDSTLYSHLCQNLTSYLWLYRLAMLRRLLFVMEAQILLEVTVRLLYRLRPAVCLYGFYWQSELPARETR
jgi:hypothetical protein